MLSTRRAAALGLLAAGGAALPTALALAQTPPAIEIPDEDGPHARLDTSRGHSDHMIAPVYINGQGPFDFLLDTGANTSCVSRQLAQKLSLRTVETRIVHTVVGKRERPMVLLDELQVGPRSRRNVRAAALSVESFGVDGVLGVDWLKGQRLILDFKGRKLEITNSQADVTEPGRVVVPARRRNGQLTIVDADLNGKKIGAIIDSGAQDTLCNDKLRQIARAQDAALGRDPTPQLIHMETLAGEAFTGEAIFLPFLRLGGLHLGNVPVVHSNTHVFDIWDLQDTPALVLGMDLLNQFEQVTLDFGRSRVRFDFT